MPRFTSANPVGNLPVVKKKQAYRDPVIEAYKRDVDRTLLRENLKLSHEQRAQKHASALAMALELRRAGQAMRQKLKR